MMDLEPLGAAAPDPPPPRRTRAEWEALVRRLRAAYDALARGDRAALSRGEYDDLRTRGPTWALLTRVFAPELDAGTMTKRELGLLIAPLALFRYAAHAAHDPAAFRTGAWVRNVFGATRGALILRRVLGARTRHALLRHLTCALRGAGRMAAVEWGTLGADLVFWQFTHVPRRIVQEQWASDFYYNSENES